MLEGLVARILNAWLGKFVEDLDAESLNVGIFSGEVQLQNLKLKPTCLLPLEVKNGVIGEVRLSIPWTSLTNKPITASIEDVFLVAHPVGFLPFDADREKQLIRALKRQVIESLESFVGDAIGGRDLVQDLLSALAQTFQVHVRNIHIRIEDPRIGFAGGICIQEFSVETTNNKWKPMLVQSSVRSVYQLVRVEALSVYLNVGLEASQCLSEDAGAYWLQGMRSALLQFQVKGIPLDFVVKPFNAKLKLIAGKTIESPILIDVVIQDAVLSISKAQLLAFFSICDLVERIPKHRKYLDFRPCVPVSGHCSAWWKYAVRATFDQRILPYTWARVFAHRKCYREYKELYKQVVARPNDSELRLDLQRCEDNLPLTSIIIAREQAKLEIRDEQPDRVDLVESGIGQKHYRLDVRRQVSTSDASPISRFIEHKLNVTIDNLSLTLLRGGREVLAMSLSHCLGSYEARSPSSYKISARAGSVLVEGASIDHELVPLITTPADNSVPAGNTPHTCFSVDFEKNPPKTVADYAIAFTLAPMEIIYHEHAVSELLSWIQGSRDSLYGWCGLAAFFVHKRIATVVTQQPSLDLTATIVTPRLILPESGSLQKGGMVLVLDFGKWEIHTELQPPLGVDDVSEITQMELEERLYHRLHVNCSALQILFSDSGEEWREKSRLEDSEVHVVSRVRGQVVLSTSIKPEYRLLPRTKLNVAFTSLQLSLSDRRVELLLDFIEGIPRPSTRSVSYVPPEVTYLFANDVVRKELSLKEFRELKNTIITLELRRLRTPSEIVSHVSSTSVADLPDLIRSAASIDISDEEAELWARTLDLPGFEDNVSPHNTITALYRITLAEIVLHVPKGVRHQDKPYLMARLSRLSLDIAEMQYGPAVQISLGGIQLIDKMHIGPCGEYLEVLSTQSDMDFFSILYRKVQADCPDFKTHFHSVEQSVVVDVGSLAVVLHREAMRSMNKFLEVLKTKVEERPLWTWIPVDWFKIRSCTTVNPPIPPGATKFSYSMYLAELRVRLREVDTDILEVKACGIQSDCTYRADERLVLRLDVNKLSVDELGDGTLYPKIVAQDEDKVLELKLVHLSSGARHGAKKNMSVGSLKLTLGRLHVLLASHVCHSLQRISEPFTGKLLKAVWELIANNLQALPKWGETLQLSLNFHLPTLLLPPGASSPSLLILNLGNLTVENFLKEDSSGGIVDNILLKLEDAFITRGLMTLAGTLESQEEIMDPFRVTLDVKRVVVGCHTAQLDAAGSIDSIKFAIGQRDLALILDIWSENRTRVAICDFFARILNNEDNPEMRCLQAFLSGADAKRRDTSARFSIDSVTIVLYTDMDELLSSPVRDMNHALCRFQIQDTVLFAETRPSGVCEIKLSIHNSSLDDIRTEAGHIITRVFYARPGGDGKLDSAISVSTPPLVDVMIKQSARGDRCIDILIEKTRANLTASFLVALVRFLGEVAPQDHIDGGVVNHGYVADTIRKVSTSNCADHNELSAVQRDRGLSLSIQLRRPEIAILGTGGGGLICRCEVLLDWSRCPGRNELVLRLAGLRVTSKNPGPMVLRPCDVEIVWNAVNSGVNITTAVSPLDLTICTSTATMLSTLAEELKILLTVEKREPQTPTNTLTHVLELEDIWSPKKMVDCFNFDACVTEPSQGEPHSFPVCTPAENLTLTIGKVTAVLGLQNGNACTPLFVVKSSFRLTAHDWSSVLNLSAELQLNVGCWNNSLQVWEPFVEPWSLELQIFQGKALPISPGGGKQVTRRRRTPDPPKQPEGSDTSGDESEHGMTFLRPDHFDVAHEVRKPQDSMHDSSDSEAEDGAFERLLDSVSDLFAGDAGSSGEDGSSSEVEAETETASTGSTHSAATERAVFLNKHTDSVDSGLETEAVERLATHILLHSKQRLELNITPATMQTMNLMNSSTFPTAPRVLANHLGPGSEISLLNQGQVLATSKFDEESPVSTPGSSRSPSPSPDSTSENMEPDGRISPDLEYHRDSLEGLRERVRGSQLSINIEGFEHLQAAVGKCENQKQFLLSPPRCGISYNVVVETRITGSVVHYVVSGPLKIQNGSSYPVGIYYNKSVLTSMGETVLGESTNPFDDLTRLTLVAPDDYYYVPLAVCFHCKLYFLPAQLANHNVSREGVSWKDLSVQPEGVLDIACLSKDGANESVFSLRASWSPEPGPSRTLKLSSPSLFRNLLPCACEFSINGATKLRLEAGEETNIYQINILETNSISIDVPDYMGLPWCGSFSLTPDCKEKSVPLVADQDREGGNKQLSIGVSIVRSQSVSLLFYSPYWMLNKTGLTLQIRGSGSDVVHELAGANPLLFCYRKQRSRSVRLRVLNSSWSSAFSIDPVGCSGLVICRDRERRKRYRIVIQCQASHTNPTLCKIITFLPHLLVENGCKKHLRFMEDNERADLWNDIAPGQCLPFWPDTDSLRMVVRLRDSKYISPIFPVHSPHITALRMDKGCGLTVVVAGGNASPLRVLFRQYEAGDAPVRVDNQCADLFLKLHQKDCPQVALLSPYQSLLYTWDDACKDRVLLWSVYNNKGREIPVQLTRDVWGEERLSFRSVRKRSHSSSASSDSEPELIPNANVLKETRKDKVVVYWVSFLKSKQRVLLLTQDERLARRARRSMEAERSSLELFLSLPGCGLSLSREDAEGAVRELAYFSLNEGSAEWEVAVAQRWKQVSLELSSWLENNYIQGVTQPQIKDYIHVDLTKMKMTKPLFGELRRRQRAAVWVQYRLSRHMSVLQAHIHRVQIDDQRLDAEMPTVVHAAASAKRRPAVELTILRKHGAPGEDVAKFGSLVIVEHLVRIDWPWLMQVLDTLTQWHSPESLQASMRRDIALLHSPIFMPRKEEVSAGSGEHVMIEHLQCSDLIVDLTLAPNPARINSACDWPIPKVLSSIISSVAPAATPVNNLPIKLFGMEVDGNGCDFISLRDRVVSHYFSQILQQFHVLVLGVNVLTNPQARLALRPLASLDDAVLPEEFSDVVSAGVEGILGLDVGASGNASVLLGTAVSHNATARSQIITEPAVPAPIWNLAHSYPHGCSLGVSGVTILPSRGAPCSGLDAFYRGTGRGIMGLLSKSAARVPDPMAMTLDALTRASSMGESIFRRTRPPRHIDPISGLKPFSIVEAQGVSMLQSLCRGHYNMDVYWGHGPLSTTFSPVLLVTLQRVMLVEKVGSSTKLDATWTERLDSIISVASADLSLIFTVQQVAEVVEKKFTFRDEAVLSWLHLRIQEALLLSTNY